MSLEAPVAAPLMLTAGEGPGTLMRQTDRLPSSTAVTKGHLQTVIRQTDRLPSSVTKGLVQTTMRQTDRLPSSMALEKRDLQVDH